MRRPGKQALWTFLILSLVTVLFTAACGSEGEPGPQGDKGPRGEQGLTGDKGPQGDQGVEGDKGPPGEKGQRGDKGQQGDKGPQGEQGSPGDPGVTFPTKLVLVPKGDVQSIQPATVTQGSREPNVWVFGSGFPEGELFFAELLDSNGLANAMAFRDGDREISEAGTFKTLVRVNANVTLEPGVYTLQVTSDSGVTGSAPVRVAAPSS